VGTMLARLALPIVFVVGAGCGGSAPRQVDQDDVSRQETLEESRLAQRQRDEWTPPVLLWELGHGQATSVLFAALPYGTTMRHALPEPHDGRLELAERVVVVHDPRALRLESAEGESALMGRRDRLDRMLEPEAWAALRAQMGPQPADEVLRRMQPSLLIEHLMRVRMAEIEAEADGRAPVAFAASTSSVMGDVLEWAVAQGVPVVALEEPAAAMARIAALPREAALERLGAVLADPDALRAAHGAVRTAYLASDDAGLARACAGIDGEGAYAEAARAARAEVLDRWAPVVQEQLAEGDAFVIVDACSAVGDGGMLARLAAAGVAARRLGAPPGSAPPRDVGGSREAGVLP
jgi:uncharacterized protein YbaP (TraB family)